MTSPAVSHRVRVLIVHNRYQQKGGEDTVVAAEEALLRSYGHDVCLLKVDNDHIQTAAARVLTAVESIYSTKGKNRVENAIQAHRPDVVHVHNFFPTLSPSVFFACFDGKVPVVHTLHNFRIQCAASTLYRNGHVCEECIEERSFLPGVRHACYRSSRVGSAVSGFGMALHAQLGTWSSKISAYIALTDFTADKLGSFRIPREKIFVKPNFVEDCGIGLGDGNYALFVGRLSPEKGVQTLIDADRAGAFCMDIIVVGDGPMRGAVDEAAARPGSRLKVKGFQGHTEIISYMKQAKVLLLTSLWYEAGLPLVAIEGISLGLPVIAAAVGNAEIVGSKEIGLLYPAGDSAGLAAALREFVADAELMAAMRQRARDYYLVTYTPESNYKQLTYIYDRAINTAKHTLSRL